MVDFHIKPVAVTSSGSLFYTRVYVCMCPW